MLNPEDVIKRLNDYKLAGSSKDMNDFFAELEFASLEVNQWSDSFVTGLLKLMADDEFRCLADSWKLLYFLNNNWEKFPENQKDNLRQVLRNAFDRYSDWMGAFTTAEILGEHYCDKVTLDIFDHLANEAAEPANATVPHGLEVLLKTTSQGDLHGLAITQLQQLTNSASEGVRQEATDAIERLRRGGHITSRGC